VTGRKDHTTRIQHGSAQAHSRVSSSDWRRSRGYGEPGGLVLIRSNVELTAPNPDRRLATFDEYSMDLMSYLEVFHKKR
jgi:hypothetical protein